MEIRRFHTSHAATLLEDTVEGRMVVRVDNTAAATTYGMNLRSGVRVPVSAAEAARSRFIISFPQTEAKPPFYIPTPAYGWSLRQGGFDRVRNLPMTPTVYMTYPGMDNMIQTIPSGWNVVCWEGGTFTVWSGQWVYNGNIVPGVELEVNYTGVPGQLQILASGTAVAMCREVTDKELTFDLYH